MNTQIPLPNSWSEVSLFKGKQIFNLNATAMTLTDYYIEIYSILTEQDKTQIHISDYILGKDQLIALMQNAKKQLEEAPETELKFEYKIGDNTYYFQYDFTDQTVDQDAATEKLIEDGMGYFKNIELILATFLREKKTKKKRYYLPAFTKRQKAIRKAEKELLNNQYELVDFTVSDRNKRAFEFLDDMNMNDVFAIVFFWLLTGLNYMKGLATYIQMQTPEKMDTTGQTT